MRLTGSGGRISGNGSWGAIVVVVDREEIGAVAVVVSLATVANLIFLAE